MGLKNFKKENKGRTACKAKQIYKITTISTQKDNLSSCHFVSLRKITRLNSQQQQTTTDVVDLQVLKLVKR